MRSEKEMMDLVLSLAEQDERIRIVTLEGSRANINIPKDEFQDYDVTYFVTDVESFTLKDEWLKSFGNIIMMQKPVLSVVYPTVVTLICLSFFKKKIRNVNLYKGAAAVSFAISFLTVLSTYGIAVPVINELPFAEYGFNWLIPTVLGGCIGNCIKSRKQMS